MPALSHAYYSIDWNLIAKRKDLKHLTGEHDDEEGYSSEAPTNHGNDERGVAGTDTVPKRADRRNDADGGGLVNDSGGGVRRKRQQGRLSPPSVGGRGRGATIIPPSPNPALCKPDSFDYLTAEVGSAVREECKTR